MVKTKLLTFVNAKTIKGEALGYLTGILYLAPWKTADGKRNVCAQATPGCRATCLYTAGRGAYDNVKKARIRKTLEFYRDPQRFAAQIRLDIAVAMEYARKRRRKYSNGLCIRLNGTSDIPFHHVSFGSPKDGLRLMEMFPFIQFYDYTKDFQRMLSYLHGYLPTNYHLTFSLSELNLNESATVLSLGGNVAIVTANGFNLLENDVPTPLYGAKHFVNGDVDDLRFLDPKGSVCILRAKGRAKHDQTGFVFRGSEILARS